MPFTECQSYIKSAKDTESRAKLKPDCTAEFADVLIAVQSAPYFLNPGLTATPGCLQIPYSRLSHNASDFGGNQLGLQRLCINLSYCIMHRLLRSFMHYYVAKSQIF